MKLPTNDFQAALLAKTHVTGKYKRILYVPVVGSYKYVACHFWLHTTQKSKSRSGPEVFASRLLLYAIHHGFPSYYIILEAHERVEAADLLSWKKSDQNIVNGMIVALLNPAGHPHAPVHGFTPYRFLLRFGL